MFYNSLYIFSLYRGEGGCKGRKYHFHFLLCLFFFIASLRKSIPIIVKESHHMFSTIETWPCAITCFNTGNLIFKDTSLDMNVNLELVENTTSLKPTYYVACCSRRVRLWRLSPLTLTVIMTTMITEWKEINYELWTKEVL